MLFKDFNDELETEYGQARRRKHVSEHKYRSGFYRIQLLPGTVNLDDTEQRKQFSKQLFFRKVEQMQEEVLSCFEGYPFPAVSKEER